MSRFGAYILAPGRIAAGMFWCQHFGADMFWRQIVLATRFGAGTFFAQLQQNHYIFILYIILYRPTQRDPDQKHGN